MTKKEIRKCTRIKDYLILNDKSPKIIISSGILKSSDAQCQRLDRMPQRISMRKGDTVKKIQINVLFPSLIGCPTEYLFFLLVLHYNYIILMFQWPPYSISRNVDLGGAMLPVLQVLADKLNMWYVFSMFYVLVIHFASMSITCCYAF